jgi:O-succinylbenzoic acid--CoA ligase
MGKPLEILQQRQGEDWLIGYDSQTLLGLAIERYQEIRSYARVLIRSRDPMQFLADFIAACSADCEVFLCNPDWVIAEWQQVHRLMDRPPLPGSHIMIPTGGTSGKLRFAMHTWETLTASVLGFQAHFEIEQVNSLCVLPLYHVSGLMQLMRSLLTGGKLAITPWKHLEAGHLPALEPADFFLSLVPTQLQRIIEQPWLGHLRTVLLGGAPAWESLLTEARSRQISLAPTYGMTETASQVATLKPADFLRGQSGCGQVLPHANVTIEGDRLIIQSKSLMLGYYPHQSNAIYQPDDIGFFEGDGFLHIAGRHSDKIITGGENVFPAEVETAIRSTNLVQDVCVIGLSDATWGQLVTAVYVPKAEFSADKLTAALAPKLTKFKRPKLWIAMDGLPRNAQGKINHSYLKLLLHKVEPQTQDACQSLSTIASARSESLPTGASSTRKIPSARSRS